MLDEVIPGTATRTTIWAVSSHHAISSRSAFALGSPQAVVSCPKTLGCIEGEVSSPGRTGVCAFTQLWSARTHASATLTRRRDRAVRRAVPQLEIPVWQPTVGCPPHQGMCQRRRIHGPFRTGSCHRGGQRSAQGTSNSRVVNSLPAEPLEKGIFPVIWRSIGGFIDDWPGPGGAGGSPTLWTSAAIPS